MIAGWYLLLWQQMWHYWSLASSSQLSDGTNVCHILHTVSFVVQFRCLSFLSLTSMLSLSVWTIAGYPPPGSLLQILFLTIIWQIIGTMTSTLHPTLAFLNYRAYIVIDVDSYKYYCDIVGKWILLIQYVSAILWVFLTLHVGEIPILAWLVRGVSLFLRPIYPLKKQA